jgi:hypothetical protein
VQRFDTIDEMDALIERPFVEVARLDEYPSAVYIVYRRR